MRDEPSVAEARILSEAQRRFVTHQRIAHLATADAHAVPHVVPICFALSDATLYFSIDQKSKRRAPSALKRLTNITANPAVAVILDHYEENWARLGWVLLRGRAEILKSGPEHGQAQSLLRRRYPQLHAMQIELLPVVAVRIERATSWGNLSVHGNKDA
jgi:PPOX class probable F420-dependent enzyme